MTEDLNLCIQARVPSHKSARGEHDTRTKIKVARWTKVQPPWELEPRRAERGTKDIEWVYKVFRDGVAVPGGYRSPRDTSHEVQNMMQATTRVNCLQDYLL